MENKEARVEGKNIGISTKHCIAICRFLKGKNIEKATQEMEEVVKMKKAIPMKKGAPHKKGMVGGKYPVKASKVFIKMLKNLEANASVKNLDTSKIKVFGKANRAPRPQRPGKYRGRKFKRTHITLIGK